MAPARKSRSVNKRFSYEASPIKNVGNSSKNKHRRKLSDKLGPQWSKGELGRFYDAYRKYGKDWKKVAMAVWNRSIEMVDALYSLNRAYLSLPDGTASVVGLIAMMTDHYNAQEQSDSERESDDAFEMQQKPHKRKQVKVHVGSSKEDSLRFRSNRPREGCLFYLRGGVSNGGQPRAVGKRTPRVPVYRESFAIPNKKARTLEVDDVARGAALALTGVFQRGGSPQVSSSLYGRTEYKKSPPVQSRGKMFQRSEKVLGKLRDASIYEKSLENGAHARSKESLVDMEGVGTVEVHRKGKNIYEKRMQVKEIENNHSDDDEEACSGTDGLKGSALKGFSPKAQRKRSKNLFNGDELDALQALADLSTLESESSVQLKEEQNTDDKCSVPEATSTIHHRDKVKPVGTKAKQLHLNAGLDGTTSRKSKIATCSPVDGQSVSEVKQESQAIGSARKRKRKFSIPMVHGDAHPSKQLKREASAEEENMSPIKTRRTGQVSPQPKRWKPSESSLGVSSIVDDHQIREGTSISMSTAQVPATTLDNILPKRPNRHKMDLKRKLNSGKKVSKTIANSSVNKYSVPAQDGLLRLKDRLSSCLSTLMVQRWCKFEWFYSAVDYPWFSKREFIEYLSHVGLGQIPRLTRVEWGVIRSSLGKPRRFSERFLNEERGKLHKYRETVRRTYTDLRTGVRVGIPTDLTRPLSVGQRVIAIHPKTREIHDGSILTVDHDKCRVQFDRPDLGVEFVMDTDCMPLDPRANTPEAIRRQNIALHKLSEVPRDPQVNAHSNLGGPMRFATGGHSEIAPSCINTLIKQEDTDHVISWSKAAALNKVTSQQASYNQAFSAHMLSREGEVRAISDVNLANVKRLMSSSQRIIMFPNHDALLRELQSANNALLEDHYNGDGSLKDFEPFRKNYSMVLSQLNEASDQASSALLQLRQRNTCPVNSSRPWMKPSATTGLFGDGSLGPQDVGSGVFETVKCSRLKASSMIDTAIQAMSSVKEGEDAFVRIGKALDSLGSHQYTSGPKSPATSSQEHANGTLGPRNQLLSDALEQIQTASGHEQYKEARIPSELISSCVASLLMIQSCTERQYPPADVAQIIDCAVTSLRPQCSQNLPLFSGIQMCMGRIKTQILALIPT